MKKRSARLLLFMCMVLTGLPAMESKAEEDTQGGETYPELQDENPYRTESVTAMDENGNITEVGDSDGSMTDGDETSSASISTYARSARMAVSSVKVVNFNTRTMRSQSIRRTAQEPSATQTETTALTPRILGPAEEK